MCSSDLRQRVRPLGMPHGNQYVNLKRGVDTVTWYGNVVLPESVEPDLLIGENGEIVRDVRGRMQADCEGSPPACRVERVDVTYNTVTVRVGAAAPSWLVVNMNCGDGWRTADVVVGCRAGRLAAWLPPDAPRTITFRYVDRRFQAGLAMAGVAALAWMAGWRRLGPSEPRGEASSGPAVPAAPARRRSVPGRFPWLGRRAGRSPARPAEARR